MTKISITGIPYTFGQSLDGISLSADHLRSNGLGQRLSRFSTIQDCGNLSFSYSKERKLQDQILDLTSNSAANREISDFISSLDPENFILNLGGDHGMGLGTIHGILNLHPESIIIWADAHGDINTPDISPSGNFHGMPLAFILGLCKNEKFSWLKNKLQSHKLILIGQRDLDDGEKKIIDELGIQCFSSEDLNHQGAKEILDMALHKADPLGTCPIHLSFDVDLFDGHDIPSTGTKVYDGPRLEEVFLLGGLLGESGRLVSMDIVEFNPTIGSTSEIQSSTELVLEFIDLTLRQVVEHRKDKGYLSPQFLSRMLGFDIINSYAANDMGTAL